VYAVSRRKIIRMGCRRVGLTIDVEIDDEEPIRGSIRRADEPSREFSGWLGLLTSLDHLLDGPGSNRPDSNGPDSNGPDSNGPDSNGPDSNAPDSNRRPSPRPSAATH
jgi:hypothetical protein